MHSSSQRPSGFALSLIALGVAALPPTAARAQTQNLFVSSGNNVTEFAGTGPGIFSTTATALPGGSLSSPQGLAFDAHGDLFAANHGTTNSITKFTPGAIPGSFTASTLTDASLSNPFGLAIDASGDLFTTNNGQSGNVIEFLPGAVPGTFGAGSILASGIEGPAGLAFDANGDLFSANLRNVTEYAAGATPGTFGTTSILSNPNLFVEQGIAVDAHGDVFVSSTYNGDIKEFVSTGAGTFAPATTFSSSLSSGLSDVAGLAFDAHGDLFAVGSKNNTTGTVTEFASTGVGTFALGTVVETVQGNVGSLAFGPATPAVPEASTTVSLGLLLALGMGGVVVAKKRRKA